MKSRRNLLSFDIEGEVQLFSLLPQDLLRLPGLITVYLHKQFCIPSCIYINAVVGVASIAHVPPIGRLEMPSCRAPIFAMLSRYLFAESVQLQSQVKAG